MRYRGSKGEQFEKKQRIHATWYATGRPNYLALDVHQVNFWCGQGLLRCVRIQTPRKRVWTHQSQWVRLRLSPHWFVYCTGFEPGSDTVRTQAANHFLFQLDLEYSPQFEPTPICRIFPIGDEAQYCNHKYFPVERRRFKLQHLPQFCPIT
jgi:hypothetical protein